MCFFYHLYCVWAHFLVLIYSVDTKYHYSIIHLLYFSLFMTVIYIMFFSYVTVLYFSPLLPGSVPSPLSCIPLFLSELSLICSLRTEFLNKKYVVTCALHWAWCNITPEWLTKHGNSDSALHDNCVGGGGISSSIMSFVCTNYSTFYGRCHLHVVLYMRWCLHSCVCCVTSYCTTCRCLVFSYNFFMNSCLICVNVYMFKKKTLFSPTPHSSGCIKR